MFETRDVDAGLAQDERWQLIERILRTAPFQKSARLPDLLRYMAERSIHGHAQDLTEHRIGSAVFGKPVGYSPVEDSSVRVHVRQLRLKLHEYFDSEGSNESLVVEIPKGAYTPVFRSVKADTAEHVAPIASVSEPPKITKRLLLLLPWALTGAMALLCLFFWQQVNSLRALLPVPPWPLSEVLAKAEQTHIVIADSNYGMLRIIAEKPGSLQQYLSPEFQQNFAPKQMSPRETRMLSYISSSLLTSYADVAVVNDLSNLFRENRYPIAIRSARDLRLRDMQEGNYIMVGSPGSNPWVSLFESKLNFIEAEGAVGESAKFFQNKKPKAGEQNTYQGLEFTGTTGEDYATISLLPTESGRGKVLILQGLQQEGTEAAGLFLADPASRQRLRDALGIKSDARGPVYFEVLIRTRATGGTPAGTTIISARLIKP